MAPEYAKVGQALAEVHLGGKIRAYWEIMPFCQLPGQEFYKYSLDLDFFRQKLAGGSTTIEMSMTGEKIDWEKSRHAIKSKGPQCRLCLLDGVCEGPWAEYAALFGTDCLRPIQEMEGLEAFLRAL